MNNKAARKVIKQCISDLEDLLSDQTFDDPTEKFERFANGFMSLADKAMQAQHEDHDYVSQISIDISRLKSEFQSYRDHYNRQQKDKAPALEEWMTEVWNSTKQEFDSSWANLPSEWRERILTFANTILSAKTLNESPRYGAALERIAWPVDGLDTVESLAAVAREALGLPMSAASGDEDDIMVQAYTIWKNRHFPNGGATSTHQNAFLSGYDAGYTVAEKKQTEDLHNDIRQAFQVGFMANGPTNPNEMTEKANQYMSFVSTRTTRREEAELKAQEQEVERGDFVRAQDFFEELKKEDL